MNNTKNILLLGNHEEQIKFLQVFFGQNFCAADMKSMMHYSIYINNINFHFIKLIDNDHYMVKITEPVDCVFLFFAKNNMKNNNISDLYQKASDIVEMKKFPCHIIYNPFNDKGQIVAINRPYFNGFQCPVFFVNYNNASAIMNKLCDLICDIDDKKNKIKNEEMKNKNQNKINNIIDDNIKNKINMLCNSDNKYNDIPIYAKDILICGMSKIISEISIDIINEPEKFKYIVNCWKYNFSEKHENIIIDYYKMKGFDCFADKMDNNRIIVIKW